MAASTFRLQRFSTSFVPFSLASHVLRFQDVDIKGVQQVRIKLRPKKPIVVVISPEGREHELSNILVQAGIPRVTYLSGGVGALLAISDPALKLIGQSNERV